MDCNKDEATRAREMAEKKLMEKDIFGAKSHASKAQGLYPGLGGLSQLQQILKIHTAYDRRINGEVDWYGVLGVDPLADVQTLRRSYRKLALALHPDKNKAVGAEDAFIIVSEAWSLLSDTGKRARYDQKLIIRASCGNISGRSTAAGIQVNVKSNFKNSASARNNFCTPVNLPTRSTPAGPVNRPTHSTPIRPSHTFWTLCKPCKTQYEYLAVYRNQTLLCRSCGLSFLALEVPPPGNSNIPRQKNSKCQNQKRVFPAGNASADSGKEFTPAPKMPSRGSSHVDFMSKGNNNKTSTAKVGGSRNKSTSARAAAQCVDGSQLNGEHLMRGRDETTNVVDVEKMYKASNDTNGSEKLEMPPPGNSNIPAGNTSADSGKEFTPAPKIPSPGYSHVDSTSKENNQRTSTSKVGGSGNKSTSARATAQCVDGSQLTGEHLMGGHDETINVVDVEKMCEASNDTNVSEPCNGLSLGKGEKLSKKARVGDYKASLLRKDAYGQKSQPLAGSGSSIDSCRHMDMLGTGNLFYSKNSRCNVSKVLSNSEVRNMLVVKAQMEIRTKLQKWKATAAKNVVSEDVVKGSPASSLMGSDTEGNELKTMSVPDPEFYDFDKDRIEEVFAANQVWAAYDDKDGMPRNYVLIHDVISREPFQVRISWLNSKSNSELGQLNWVECGFAKTCGDFRIGKREAYSDLISFSHRVKWSKGIRGVIRIFPQKGDVWALYRNWSPEWNEQTPDDVIWKYDIVEVADDFSEEQGVLVTPLVKVAGFRSVFHRLDTSKEYRIPRAEMFRFSHQVASYTLTGQEAETLPKGCRELDTAALPWELLEIITEFMEEGSEESSSTDANAGNVISRVYSRKRKKTIKEPGEGSKQSGGDNANVRSPITLVYSRKRKEPIKKPGEGSKQAGRDNANARPPITLVYSRTRR